MEEDLANVSLEYCVHSFAAALLIVFALFGIAKGVAELKPLVPFAKVGLAAVGFFAG